jgi:mannan endo-1,4-beta-mannosidase
MSNGASPDWEKQPMRSLKKLSCSLVVVAAMFAPTMVAHAESSQIYWGAYVDGAPFDTSRITDFENDAGKKQSIVHWAQPWSMNGSMQSFQTPQFEAVRKRGSIPMLGWGSWALGGSATSQPNYQLADIYNGHFDSYITKWAQAAHAWGHPFFLRFDHEMNGNWYSWSERTNGNKAGDFVKAWRHVHDLFRQAGATNATWVWCPNLTSKTTTPLSGLYPGDSYVDWTCMDGYNWGTDHNNKWYSFSQVFGVNPWTQHSTYKDILAVAPNKPMMIGETATSKDGGDPAAWIRDVLQTQLPKNFTAVKALVWFNWNVNDPVIDWPIESTSAMQSAFRSGISSSYYASNQFANLPSGPIKPPGGSSSPSQQPSSSPPPSSSGGSTSVTLLDVADTYIDKSDPSSADGGARSSLRSHGGTPYQVAFMRFDLTSLRGKTITAARLRIHTTGDTGSGTSSSQKLMFVSSDNWNQKFMSWENDVSISSNQLGTIVAPDRSTWYSGSLSASGVQSNAGNWLSIAVVPTSSDTVIFSSREGGSSVAPQLVVTYK